MLIPYDYRQNDNVTLLQIIDDKKQITGKNSIITACNVDYRLKRSGPKAPLLFEETFITH